MNRKLFGHPDSGHAFKVRLYLCVAGIEHARGVKACLARMSSLDGWQHPYQLLSPEQAG